MAKSGFAFCFWLSALVVSSLLCSAHGAFAQGCTPPPAGLVAWWTGDGISSDVYAGHNGILHNGATFTDSGVTGQAFWFDGIDDWVEVPDSRELDLGTGDFTISAYVYFSTDSIAYPLVEKFVGNGPIQQGWTLSGAESAENTFFQCGSGGYPTDVYGPWGGVPVPRYAWVHLAARRSNGTIMLFEDGLADEPQYNPGNFDTTVSLKIGHRGNPFDTPGAGPSGLSYHTGAIDEVQIFHRALSDQEITDLAGRPNQCRPDPVCGNGRTEVGEVCDDGNLVSDDGCENDCTSSCGNGNRTGTEECDDGNHVSGDGCDEDCTLTRCGNRIVTGGEECDDGNTVQTDACLTNCLSNVCGDGFVFANVEVCDDGNAVDTDACPTTCVPATCEDGFVYAGVEACDDGNDANGDGCDWNCTLTACGNGVRTIGEWCDDGNLVNGDGCQDTCVRSEGQLDPSFDFDGIVLGDKVSTVAAARVLSDGRIVVAYTDATQADPRFAVARYNSDGSLDTSFGSGGVTTTLIGNVAFAEAMVVQPDGKFVLAGFSNSGAGNRVTVARYDEAGSLDTTFGSGGVVIRPTPGSATDVAVDSNGAIVVGGYDENYRLLLIRLKPNGVPDASFSGDALVIDPLFPGVQSVAVLPDNRIVAATRYDSRGPAVVRFTAAGDLDRFFGDGGAKAVDVNSSVLSAAVALQADGKIVVATSAGEDEATSAVRLTVDGELDTSFAGDGVSSVYAGGGGDNQPADVAIGDDGSITVVGKVWTSGPYTSHYGEIAVVRYRADGTVDRGFDGDGWLTTAVGFGHDYPRSVVIQPDGKILVAGITDDGGPSGGLPARLALVRYLSGTCGDLRAQTADGEQCDDGNATNGDGCESDCKLTTVAETFDVGGGTASSDPLGLGATEMVPVQTAVTTTGVGTVTIEPAVPADSAAGFEIVGIQLQIDAPPGKKEAPLAIVLTVDPSALPAGVDASRLEVMRDGDPIGGCTGAPGTADPDPCVSDRSVTAGGDVQITVLTIHASLWGFGVRALQAAEQDCVNAFGKSIAAVGKAQAKVNAGCLKLAAKSTPPGLQACLLADSAGAVSKAESAAGGTAADRCVPAPAFGLAGAPSSASQEARDSEIALFADVFGGDPDSVVATSKEGASCQASTLKTVQKLFDTEVKLVLSCAQSGLAAAEPPMVRSVDLALCLEAFGADVGGKVAKATAKIASTLDARCSGDVPTLLPGACANAEFPVRCLAQSVACRVCTMFDAAWGLGADCDAVDDRTYNGSCN